MTRETDFPTKNYGNLGLTHFALNVNDVDATIDFYKRYAALEAVHHRGAGGGRVVWLSDRKHPFGIVVIQRRRSAWKRWLARQLNLRRPGLAHVGIALGSREEVDALCEKARREGILRRAPHDAGDPVNYYGMIADPDGNYLEVSHDQVVSDAVVDAVVDAANDGGQGTA